LALAPILLLHGQPSRGATLGAVYRWVDHTAEVELAIEAGGEREVFADALTALAELHGAGDRPGGGSGDGAGDREDQRREVCAQAPDRPALLAAWLEELLFLAETEGFVATRIVDLALTADRVDATVAGFIGNPPPLVKAVTYHRLRFDRHGSGYSAGVVLDV
jgi:SHS2 domain-containing protein